MCSSGRGRSRPGQDFLLGCHLSIAGGLERVFDVAEELGMTAVQIFSHNARSWRMLSSPLPRAAVEGFRARWQESFVRYVAIHTIYLINLASPDPGLWERSIAAVTAELERAGELGIPEVCTHVGAHMGRGLHRGLERAGEALRIILDRTAHLPVRLLLENTAGGGTTLGGRFEELGALIEQAGAQPERLGVCFDTCHAFAAGYDLSTAAGVERALAELDRAVGLERLRLVHLNDSRHPLGSRKDRHEHIGRGRIGLAGFRAIVNHPILRELPFILETPKMLHEEEKLDSEADRLNLARVRALRAPAAARSCQSGRGGEQTKSRGGRSAS